MKWEKFPEEIGLIIDGFGVHFAGNWWFGLFFWFVFGRNSAGFRLVEAELSFDRLWPISGV